MPNAINILNGYMLNLNDVAANTMISKSKSKIIVFEHRSQEDLLFLRLCLYKRETVAHYRETGEVPV